MMDKKYHVENTEQVTLGRFTIQLDTVAECGREYPYSYIHMKKSVGILPICDKRILLIRQYRHSVGSYEFEIPGGSVEEGEDPRNTAVRELREETGYAAVKMDFLGWYYPSPGSSNEETCLYMAECVPSGETKREVLEYMENVLVDECTLEELIIKNEFVHGMGIAAWLKYVLRRKKNDC